MSLRPAATVVLVRRGALAPEILTVRRSRGAAFMADAFVFPGGRVEPADGEGDAAFVRAAAREAAEEAGVTIDVTQLIPLSHWITPSAEPKRFDTRFFIAEAPADLTVTVDDAEVTEYRWATAADYIVFAERGELKLPPPTLATMVDLAVHPTVDAILAWATHRPIAAIQPKVAMFDGRLAIVLPWDDAFASLDGEGTPIPRTHPMLATMADAITNGPSRFYLDDGRWRRG